MTDDPGVRDMLKFNLARDTLHQNLWLKAIEELQEDGLEDVVVPDALFDEEYAEHASAIWDLSEGTEGTQEAGPPARNRTAGTSSPTSSIPSRSAASPRHRHLTPRCTTPTTAPWASRGGLSWAPRPGPWASSRTS